jgi:drug/metabolite transporter (DMT)-like permease
MILQIVSKIISESLLSLYPVFVKLINLPIGIQLWSRFFIYTVISSFFVNWNFIKNTILSKYGVLLSLVTIIHVYSSYRGFQLLDSGVAYVIFYTYPIIILLLSGEKFSMMILLAILGVYLLSQTKDSDKTDKEINKQKERFKYEGILMMIIASFTEAIIYFIVRNIKTDNNWNHIFISYALCGIFLTLYYFNYIKKYNIENINNNIIISLIINAFIGLFGYLLRFYAMSKLSPTVYAPLSYIGIITAYLYGIFINKDIINIKKIIGTLFIILSNYH